MPQFKPCTTFIKLLHNNKSGKNLIYCYENCNRKEKIWNNENCIVHQAVAEGFQLPLTILNISKKYIFWKWQYKLHIALVVNQIILDIFISWWAGHNRENRKWPLAGLLYIKYNFEGNCFKIYGVTEVYLRIKALKLSAKSVIGGKKTEHLKGWNYLGCNVAYIGNNHVYNKLQNFQYCRRKIGSTCETDRRKILLKFYKITATSTPPCGHEIGTLLKQHERKL